MSVKKLQLEQVNNKLKGFVALKDNHVPPIGWIKAIRQSIGMSQQQLGNKLNITKQSVQEIEAREKKSSITLKALHEVAGALDMQLLYGFVPNDGSLDALIERKAKELAKKIILRTSNSMVLEDQGNSEDRLQTAIDNMAAELKREMPKVLWD